MSGRVRSPRWTSVPRPPHHLGLCAAGAGEPGLPALAQLAARSGIDLRDLESALVRLALAHRHRMSSCPGGPACTLLAGDSREDSGQ